MSLSQPVTESVSFVTKDAVHCIFIDAECVLPSANRLDDYNTDSNSTYANGMVGSPFANLQILYAYQRVCDFPGWGRPLKNKTHDPSSCFSTGAGGHSNCVEEYVEYVYSLRNELLGWRFFFVSRDPEFSFDRGLSEAFKEETQRLARLRKTGLRIQPPKIRKTFCLPTSQRKWVREFLSPYLDAMFDDNSVTAEKLNIAVTMDLNNAANPAFTPKCLTLEWTNEVLLRRFGDRIDQRYRSVDVYHGTVAVNRHVPDNDFFEEPEAIVGVATVTKLLFPFNAYPVQHSCRDPKVFFFMDLRNPPETIERSLALKYGNLAGVDEDLLARYTNRIYQDNNKYMREEITRLLEAHETEQKENIALDPVRRRIQFDLRECASPEDRHRYRCSDPASLACTSTMFNDLDNPCDRVILDYHAGKVKDDEQWSTVEPKMYAMDRTLSEFGNLVSARMAISETTGGGIANLHKEIFMVQLTRCNAGDTEDSKLRTHFMFVGPPGSGKSYILDKHADTCIPNAVRWLSSQSEKANTTSEVYNGSQVLIDEAPAALITGGLDGTGDPNWKSFLSKGVIVTETACFDPDTKERYSTITISKRKSIVIAATNARVGGIPPAIISRFYVCDVPEQHRADMDAVLASRKIESDLRMQTEYAAYVDYWQKIQFLSFSLWARIRTSLFPRPNNELVLHISSLTFSYLYREHGVRVEKRDQERIMDMTMAVTIYHAIHKVFISGDVIRQGTPYHPTQLAKLIPYLHCTREHFYFAFSLLDQIVANPCALIVLDGLKHINNGYAHNDERFSPPTKERPYVDFNYYSVTLASVASGSDVLPLVAKLVVLNVANTTNFELSSDSVRDILGKFADMSTTCSRYDEHGNKTGEKHRIPVIRLRNSGFRSGIEISREFLDETITKRTNLVEEAIKASFDQYMPGTRLVTGMSKRYGYKTESSVPFIFTVIPVGDRSTYPTLVLPKDEHDNDLQMFLKTGKRQRMAESMYERCEYSIDKHCAEKWYASMGVRPEPESDGSEEEVYGVYPDDVIATYEREHAKPAACSTYAAPTHTSEEWRDVLDDPDFYS